MASCMQQGPDRKIWLVRELNGKVSKLILWNSALGELVKPAARKFILLGNYFGSHWEDWLRYWSENSSNVIVLDI
jgi:hypothetical protein